MKKIVSIIVILVTLFAFVSCEFIPTNTTTPTTDDSVSSTTTTTSTTTATTTTTTTTTTPNETPKEASEGLSYALHELYEGYTVVGIGTCTDKDVVILSEYMGLPVYAIGQTAFLESNFIETVFIPDTVVELGYLPFALCNSLVSIEVSPTHPYFVSINGDLYIKEGVSVTFEGKIFYQYALGKTDITFTVPGDVDYIAPGAFASCMTLEEIIISEGVEHIDYANFSMCTALKTLHIPSTVINIGPAIMEESANLETIIYNGTVDQWKNIDKHSSWDWHSAEYTIYCTDGEISADGTVTYK